MIKSLTIQKLIADKQGAQAESQRLEDDLKKEYVLLESRVAAAIAQFKSDQDKMHEKTIDNLLSQLQEIRTQGTKNITNYFWSIAFQYGFYNELETKLQFKKWIENTRTGSFTVKLVGTEAKKTDLLASLNNNPLFAISVKAQATLQEVIESPFNPRLKLGALEKAIERIADKNVKNSILVNLHTYKMLSFLYRGLSYDRGADSEQKRKNISDALDSFMMYFAAKAIPVGIGMEETPPVILFQLSGTYVYVSTILKLLYKEILQARFVGKSGLSKYVASFSPRVSTMSNIYKNHLKDKKWGTRKNFFENYIAIHKYDFTIPKIYITKNRNK
jgi:G:T/U-mismatch repair DNA glycosylase